MSKDLFELSLILDAQFKKRHASENAFYSLRRGVRQIQKYANSMPPGTDLGIILQSYIDDKTKQLKITPKKRRFNIRRDRATASRLLDIYYGRPIKWQHTRPSKFVLSPYYNNLLEVIKPIIKERYSDANFFGFVSQARKLFDWLEKNQVNNIGDITQELIVKFTESEARRSMEYGRTMIARTRTILSILHEKGFISGEYRRAFLLHSKTRHPLLPPAKPEIVKDIMDHIDRSTSKGKRDYAIILLAVVTGIRSVDIRKMKLSSVNWADGVISLVQSKTGKRISFVLTKDIADALIDYIENARSPYAQDNLLFHAAFPPFGLMGRCIISESYRRRAQQLGYSGYDAQFHGIRRMRAVSLINSGAPLPIVTETLGHSGADSTEKYLSFDQKKLKFCALSLTVTLVDKGAQV